jgi:pyruvate dehydrogenase E1 component alpha subunit
MVLMRTFDTKALKLQRQGRMGTWPPINREHGIKVLRGVPLHLVFAYWAGDERGSSYPEDVRCFPVAVPVGSQWQHGAGVGLSLKLRGEDAVAVTFGGDGSTSEGDFHEAVNCAGVFGAKTVFVIQNNQWAISVPLHRQTAAETLAQKAHAYGISGIQVDGNDVFAVYAAATEAIERTRRGDGPCLIEAVTYRLGDHTTADDASRYRPEEELEKWEGRDPILRLRRFLVEQGLWDDDQEAVLLEEATTWVDGQVKAFEDMEPQVPEEIFTSMYAAMPPHVVEQMQWLLEEVQS